MTPLYIYYKSIYLNIFLSFFFFKEKKERKKEYNNGHLAAPTEINDENVISVFSKIKKWFEPIQAGHSRIKAEKKGTNAGRRLPISGNEKD